MERDYPGYEGREITRGDRCAIKSDGKIRLACNTVLAGEDVVLEPAGGTVLKI